LRATVADFLPPSLRDLDVVEGSQTGAGSMSECRRLALTSRFDVCSTLTSMRPVITPDLNAPVFIRCRVDCGDVRINAE